MVIYKVTNLINGKQYIGRDSKNNPNYYGSGPGIINAIKKYGKENFKKEIIEECNDFDSLVKREEYWLNYYDVGKNPMFYNMHNSGIGNGAGENHPNFGKPVSDETKRKLRHAHLGRPKSKEAVEKMRKALTGRKLSIEHRRKLSNIFGGENHPNYGKRRKKETVDKIRNSMLGKKHSDETKQKMSRSRTGEKNRFFKGYILCTNGVYEGQTRTMYEWATLLEKHRSAISSHLYGKRYKNGINGNFFRWI
jgi:group I intron endonuclease